MLSSLQDRSERPQKMYVKLTRLATFPGVYALFYGEAKCVIVVVQEVVIISVVEFSLVTTQFTNSIASRPRCSASCFCLLR